MHALEPPGEGDAPTIQMLKGPSASALEVESEASPSLPRLTLTRVTSVTLKGGSGSFPGETAFECLRYHSTPPQTRALLDFAARSVERRGGKECDSTGR